MHYFDNINSKIKNKDIFEFKYSFDDENFSFKSHHNLFSKNKVDKGSEVLLKTVISEFNLENKNILDIGCGYGVIGVVLAKLYKNSKILMSDITEQAIFIAEINTANNHVSKNTRVIKSNLFENIDKSKKFDYIITNPPIRAGKNVLNKLFYNVKEYLNKNGKFIIVIRKNHGLNSVKTYLLNNGMTVDIINKKSGYFVLVAKN